MSAAGPNPPPFYCPACGKKHRADLSALIGHEGASAKVDCHRCGIEMTLSVGSDGLPKCETHGPPADPSAVQAMSPAEAAAVLSGGAMSKSNLPLHLLLAAVVAAVVSFGVVSATKGDGEKDGDASRMEALEQRIQELEASAEQDVPSVAQSDPEALNALEKKLRASITSVEEGLAAQTKTLAGLEQLHAQMSNAFAKVQQAYKKLNGRIEANYQAGREVDKRLKALEAK